MLGRDWLISRGLTVVEGDPFNDSEVTASFFPDATVWRPIQYASGYSLDLYCDQRTSDWSHNAGFPVTFTGESFGDCAKQARAQGWKIHRQTRTATCPRCARKKEG